MEVSAEVEARFWAKVDRSGGPDACWPWMAYCHRNGHGLVKVTNISKSPLFAHRLGYIIQTGKDPGAALLRHTCDNAPCCNAKHLIEGTHLENMQDMVERNRSAKGERNGNVKLEEEQVRAIKALPPSIPNARVAKLFGVSASAVQQIRANLTWKHIS